MASFEQQVKAWADKANARLELAVRKIALDAFSEVVLMSPVKSGRFRGNWQVAIGNIPQGTIALEDKTGQVVISKIEAETMDLQVGQTIYLVNNLPYAQRLEYGWSQQAPGGMVRITAQRYQQIVDRVVAEIRNS